MEQVFERFLRRDLLAFALLKTVRHCRQIELLGVLK